MIKLYGRDKKLRVLLKSKEKTNFVMKLISNNINLSSLVRWNALKLSQKNNVSYVNLSNRCLFSINKKRLNKWSAFSRHIYLKLLRSGSIVGFQKSSW
jgi:ribosomal protein S14